MKTIDYYILVGQTPVPVDDVLEWARLFEGGERIVRQEKVGDYAWVSTVFLGLEHNFHRRMYGAGAGEPHIFETMCFWDGDGQEQERCGTWLKAEENHRQMVAYARSVRGFLTYVLRTLRDSVDQALRELLAIPYAASNER